MYLYKFELTYIYDGKEYIKTYSKFCKRYASTKLYKLLMQELSDPGDPQYKAKMLKVYI